MAPQQQCDFTVRPMRPGEVSLIREWANGEGWNPGVHDGLCFYRTDPAGFFLGELDGEPVSCVSCVAYDSTYGFLGQYIVRPGFRGTGYGLRTWQAGIAHLGTRNVGLDGVLNQQENYGRSGFRFAHQDIRYAGQGGGKVSPGVVRLSAIASDEVLTYDRTCFPAPRPTFLHQWIRLPEAASLGYLREGRLAGYGVIRRSTDGFKVGPLFADDLGVAEALLGSLATEVGGAFCVDTPDAATNPAAARLVERFGLTEVFRTARMYTQGPPAIDTGRVFGITTMELG